ncbi:MAG: ATP phosphoribosyltransferase regulatory subunit [Methylohalobius sp.]|nr:ATP phosphoribosyltransferase regulatory subunit [Methylohalobius sp.]
MKGLPTDRWLLPDGIEELLPDEARRLEQLRRCLLDTCLAFGYELVFPPLVDFLDSLLTGAGHDLELQTFKLTDPVSGRLLGVRADLTPQVARIDAHHLKRQGPTRLCYVGTVLRAYADPLDKSRSPIQIGAELYGHAGAEADLEVIRLLLELLARAGVLNVHLDLGHVGIYRGLARRAGLKADEEALLFAILQRKSRPDLNQFLARCSCPKEAKTSFAALLELNGDADVLAQARTQLANAGEEVVAALERLEQVAMRIRRLYPALPIHFDLAELRGYHYHTGLVFAALVPGQGREIARGGRYDDIGEVFGQARPAVGFSADLKQLLRLGVQVEEAPAKRLFAPYGEDPELLEAIRTLRNEGWQVVQALSDREDPRQLGCSFRLERRNGRYETTSLIA